MVDVEQLVDPELEGLLRELASRPRSVFLRSSRKDAMRVLRSRTTPGVSAMAVSDALERELVTVHRAELAEILKEACRTRLLEGEREKLFMVPYTGVGDPHHPTPMKQLNSRLVRSAQSDTPSPGNGETGLVSELLTPSGSRIPSVLDLAAMGQRIQPCDSWRLLAAISFISNRMTKSASALASTVMVGWPSADDSLRALEILALAEVIEGCPAQGAEYQDQACAIRGDYPLGLLNLFRYSLLALQEQAVIKASDRLRAIVRPDHPLVSQSCEVSLARRGTGDWEPSEASTRMAIRLESSLGDVAREVSHVFH